MCFANPTFHFGSDKWKRLSSPITLTPQEVTDTQGAFHFTYSPETQLACDKSKLLDIFKNLIHTKQINLKSSSEHCFQKQ